MISEHIPKIKATWHLILSPDSSQEKDWQDKDK